MSPVETALRRARSQVGYIALPLKNSVYVSSGQDWNGAFLSYVYTEGELPASPNSTAALLQAFIQARRFRANPKPGDIAFYAFPASGGGQMHVGLVTESAAWRRDGSFRAIEGQTLNPAPRAPRTEPGVFEHTRFVTDVIGFGRPRTRKKPRRDRRPISAVPRVRAADFAYGKSSLATGLLQLALADQLGVQNFRRGMFDHKTRAALTAYQRRAGLPPTGVADENSLDSLGVDTGIFTCERR